MKLIINLSIRIYTMTKETCQELHIIGWEYPEKYDGVYDWYCTCIKQKVCRWKLTPDGQRTREEDPDAFDKLCEDCEIPSQD